MTSRSPQQSPSAEPAPGSAQETKPWQVVVSAVILLHNIMFIGQCIERERDAEHDAPSRAISASQELPSAPAPEPRAPSPPQPTSRPRSASRPSAPSSSAAPTSLSTAFEHASTSPFPPHEQTVKHRQPWFCRYRWVIAENVVLCSELELSASQVETVESMLREAARLFPVYARTHDITFANYWIPLVVYVVTHATINNNSLFFHKFQKPVVGRYTVGAIYVTPEMFLKAGTTDLAHEVSHYGVDNGPFMDLDQNEKHAQAFEEFVQQVRRCGADGERC